MKEENRHRVVHERRSSADAATLYDLVVEARRWPVIFKPTVDVDILESTEEGERFRIWATVNNTVRTWTSRRAFDRRGRRVRFVQEEPMTPVDYMAGEWTFTTASDGGTNIRLVHESLKDVEEALGENSAQELDALVAFAEIGYGIDDVVATFEDDVLLPISVEKAYDFIAESDRWPEVLDHVKRVRLSKPNPETQFMEMETITQDGQTHTTQSVRICTTNKRIAYKQYKFPPLLLGHSGRWEFTAEGDGGCRVTSEHTVAINPEAIASALGPGATVFDARVHIRRLLGANSQATLAAMEKYTGRRGSEQYEGQE
jgi:aromatase